MTRESLVTQDWEGVVARLGGATTLEQSARDTKAFLRARAVATAVDLLRLILAYCLSDRGLRSTAAWATAIGLANLSNVALLQRLRRCGDWLALLVGEALGRRRAASEPRPPDPDHRCDDGPKGRSGSQEGEQAVAHSQRLRPSARALRSFRADRSAWGRDARSDPRR